MGRDIKVFGLTIRDFHISIQQCNIHDLRLNLAYLHILRLILIPILVT